jgi:anti-sigma28 factor (negative regulator of flagellin synthesis)
MKIYNRDVSLLHTTEQPGRKRAESAISNTGPDEFHLSELVTRLRALAADSPERQERLEQIARSYANGTYKVDAEATASAIIEDSLRYR